MAEIPGIQLSAGMVQNAGNPVDLKQNLTTTQRLGLTLVQRWLGMIVYDKDLLVWKELDTNPSGNTTTESDWKNHGGASSTEQLYESALWDSTLNVQSENTLNLDENRSRIFAQKAGSITSIKIYVEDLGTNPNSVAINFVVGSSNLLTANQVLVAGWNTFTTLQNTAVLENQEIKLAVRTASGNDNIGDAQIYILVE